MTIAQLLHEAKNAAGDRAVAAAGEQDYSRAHDWVALSVELGFVLRKAVELEASGAGEAIASRRVDVLEREAPHLLAPSSSLEAGCHDA